MAEAQPNCKNLRLVVPGEVIATFFGECNRDFPKSVDGTSVYPRVIVKRALELNAAAVIFNHNHPSSVAEPGR